MFIEALNNHARFYRWAKDSNGKFISCNDELAQDVGLDKGEELIGLTDFDLCWTEMAEHFRRNDNEVIATQYPKTFIETTVCIRKRLYRGYSHKAPLIGNTKKIIGTVGSGLVIDFQSSSNNFLENDLSKRQLECLLYLVKGMTAKEIGKILNLSFRTVEAHIETLKHKLKCTSKSELIKKALTLNSVITALFL